MLFVWASGHAQTVYSIEDFQNYSVYHGLSDNSVNALTFDSLGYLWVGTKYGLNRFDGNSFDVFTIPSHPDVLPGNYISSMERYAPNKMYLCTRNGLGILNMHRLKLQRYKLADTTIIGEYMQKAYSMRWLTSDKLAVSSTTGFMSLMLTGVFILIILFFRLQILDKNASLLGKRFSKSVPRIFWYMPINHAYIFIMLSVIHSTN